MKKVLLSFVFALCSCVTIGAKDICPDDMSEAETYNVQYDGVEGVDQTISYVDYSLSGSEKYVLRVDGHPFYPTEVQMRWDKLYGYNGWTDDEMEACGKQAAEDGFNTLAVPVFWVEVEPEKDKFDWQILDKYMGWCKKYGMRMELLWFSWSSGGRIQYMWNYNGRQSLRTPDYVCSLAGTSDYNMLRKEWEYSLDWRDTDLRTRETYVLSKVMDHIAQWEVLNGQPHTVIGVQLGNEARAHGANSATAAEIIEYYSAVGSAVKESKHKVWTRLNCVSYETSGRTSANESKRNNGGTNIDFVGIDVYGTSASAVKGDISGQLGVNGKNFRMIMEIDAQDSSSPLYQMAALAGNKAFNYYNYCVVDGNCLYAGNGHSIVPRSHVPLTRQRNKVLNLANQDMAIKKQGTGLYVYNYSGASTSAETGLHDISFVPLKSTTQAIAVHHSNQEILLMSTAAGVFSIPEELDVKRVTYGHTNENNQWVAEKLSRMTTATTFRFLRAECVRLECGTLLNDVPKDIEDYAEDSVFNIAIVASKVEASFTGSNWNVNYINDEDTSASMWCNWYSTEGCHEGDTLTYTWLKACTISGTTIYFAGTKVAIDNGLYLPASFTVEYLGEDKQWHTVAAKAEQDISGVVSVDFDEPVSTMGIRLNMTAQSYGGSFCAVGVNEWEVYGCDTGNSGGLSNIAVKVSEITPSYTGSNWSKYHLNDELLSTMWCNWYSTEGCHETESVQYTWKKSYNIGMTSIYFAGDETPLNNGLFLPQSATLEYLDSEGNWKPVNLKQGSELAPVAGEATTVEFDEVSTTSLRLTMTAQMYDDTYCAVGINEWEVYANDDEGEDDDPSSVDPADYYNQDYADLFPDEWVTIKNGAMWKHDGLTSSVASTTVQAHAPGFLRVGDTYYMCGEDRSSTWVPDVNLYSSKNLVDWHFERKIVAIEDYYPDIVSTWHMIERPKLLYCAKTGKFLVWCHFEYSNYGAQESACFECDSVNGKYEYVWSGQPYGTKARDCNVFQDNDGKAYFVATIQDNNHIGLFELSPDYHEVVSQTTLFWWKSREAPAIVHVGDYYYMLSSACSGWAPNRCKIAYSKSLTSGWSDLKDLNNPWAYDTQAAQIITVKGTKTTTYLYVGDRWQDPGLFESKIIIFPISFSGTTCSFPYHQQFDINFHTGEWRETPTEGLRVPKDKWKLVEASDEETSAEYRPARHAIDGDLNTFWHSRYTGEVALYPHDITVDMGAEYEVCGFCAMPRMDNSSNGVVRQFSMQTSTDGEHWQLVSGGDWLTYGGEVFFPKTTVRYFRFAAQSCDDGGAYCCISEIDMLLQAPEYKSASISGSHASGTSTSFSTTKTFVVREGTDVTFKTVNPSEVSGEGSYAFGGGYGNAAEKNWEKLADAHAKEVTVSNFTSDMAGTYVAAYFNHYFNETSTYSYVVKVKERTDAIDDTYEMEVTPSAYYTLDGVYLGKTCPDGMAGKVVFMIMSDGSKKKLLLRK